MTRPSNPLHRVGVTNRFKGLDLIDNGAWRNMDRDS